MAALTATSVKMQGPKGGTPTLGAGVYLPATAVPAASAAKGGYVYVG